MKRALAQGENRTLVLPLDLREHGLKAENGILVFILIPASALDKNGVFSQYFCTFCFLFFYKSQIARGKNISFTFDSHNLLRTIHIVSYPVRLRVSI